MKKIFNSLTIKQILFASLIIHLIAAIFSAGYHHSDEHYQIIEFLNSKINPAVIKDLPWEYQFQVRPWFQVFWYFGIYKILAFYSPPSPFLLIATIRFVTAMFSFLAFFKFQELIKKWFSNETEEKVATILFHFVWFFPYIQSRTSSENFGLSFFLLGLVYFFRKTKSSLFSSGLLLSFAYLSRTQMAIMVASFWFWVVLYKELSIKHLAIFTIGIIAGILAGPLFDFWGYHALTFVPWNYYQANFTRGILASSGIQPWYFYFTEIWRRAIAPLGLFIFITLGYFALKKRSHLVSFISLPFFLFHTSLGHKELRFLFPIAPFFALGFAIFLFENKVKLNSLWEKHVLMRLFGKLSLGLNVLLLLWTIFTPANAYHRFYAFIYDKPEIKSLYYIGENPYWIGDLKLSFYKPDYLELTKVTTSSEISQNQFFLFMNDSTLAASFMKKPKCKLAYSSYPQWMYEKLMFVRGFARTRAWALFNCTK